MTLPKEEYLDSDKVTEELLNAQNLSIVDKTSICQRNLSTTSTTTTQDCFTGYLPNYLDFNNDLMHSWQTVQPN